MTTLTDKFTELEEQLAGQEATIAAYIDTVETKLQSMLDMLDIINVNAAANTKYLLAALSQTGACFPCPSPPMIVPPIGTTEGSINSDRCKRAQAIIAVIHALLENMDTMQSFNVIGTYNVIAGAITDYIGTIAAGDTVPLPSAPEAINIVGDYVSYAGERIFSGLGLVEQFAPLESDLILAIYNTTTPGAAQDAYNAVIDGSTVTNGASLLFKAIAYTALWSYYFDPDSEPDLSAYSGTLCAEAGCMDIDSSPVTTSGFAGNAIVWTEPFSGTDNGGTGVWSDNVFCTTQLSGYTCTCTENVRIYDVNGGSFDDLNVGNTHTFGTTTFAIVFDAGNGTPFTMTICPPV